MQTAEMSAPQRRNKTWLVPLPLVRTSPLKPVSLNQSGGFLHSRIHTMAKTMSKKTQEKLERMEKLADAEAKAARK
jgi:hypothetical protein